MKLHNKVTRRDDLSYQPRSLLRGAVETLSCVATTNLEVSGARNVEPIRLASKFQAYCVAVRGLQ